jgi:pimeloyl-ACP methyl ester carboxylesterase
MIVEHSDLTYLEMPTGERIAVLSAIGDGDNEENPGLFWLGGFKSAMVGTKATALSEWAFETGTASCRFDYSGNGLSDQNNFENATISKWLTQAMAVFEARAPGPQIVIGSSMGGWLALLLYRALAQRGEAGRVAAMVLIAPAADMTKYLMWDVFPTSVRAVIETKGVWYQPSAYGDGDYPITRKLIEDSATHLILEEGLDVACPVRILHGSADPDVPWQHGERLYKALRGSDISFTLVENGDHRLSSPADIDTLIETISQLPT